MNRTETMCAYCKYYWEDCPVGDAHDTDDIDCPMYEGVEEEM